MIDRLPIAAGNSADSQEVGGMSGRRAPHEVIRLAFGMGRMARRVAPAALLAAVAVHGTLGGSDALAERTRVHAAMSAALANVSAPVASPLALLPSGADLTLEQPLPAVPLAAALELATSSSFTGESARFEPWLHQRPDAEDSSRKPRQLEREQANIARFIAARYRVTLDATTEFVHHAYLAARDARIDPMLVLAVMSVESSFDPRAQSSAGAQGLMQVLTRVHVEKFMPFGGIRAAFDPVANIRVGSAILREYIQRDGSVEGALKSYVGAALMEHDGGYGAKVLNARERIAAAAAGKPIPPELAMAAPRTERVALVRAGAATQASDTAEPTAVPVIMFEPARAASTAPAPVSPPEASGAQPSAQGAASGHGEI